MAEVDYYEMLGVESTATRSDIRQAFRLLAMKYHPDQNRDNPVAEERFKNITQAYKVLIDAKRRSQYDRIRQAAEGQRRRAEAEARQRAAERQEDRDSGFGESRSTVGSRSARTTVGKQHTPWWQEEMERLKPRSQTQTPPPQPKPQPQEPDWNIYVDMTLPKDLALRGGPQPISLSRDSICPACEGSGARKGTPIRPCPECSGKPRPNCPYCKGRGQLIQSQCPDCRGEGKIRERKTLTVNIPPATKDGQSIRIAGEGKITPGDAPNGDLLVRIHIKKSQEYERREGAVYSEVHITAAMAAMGGTVRVKTVDSAVDLLIPPGTQPGTVFKLEGMGPPIRPDVRGDHFVTVQIVHV